MAETFDALKAWWLDKMEKGLAEQLAPGQTIYDPVMTEEQRQRGAGTLKAALPRMVTAIPEFVNFVGQGIDTFQQPSVDEDGNPVPVVNRFANARYGSDPAKAKEVNDFQIEETKKRIQAGDTRPPEDIYKEVGDSPEFKEFADQRVPVIRRYTDKAADAIDTYFGAPIDTKKTTEEKVLTNALQLAVPTGWATQGLKNLPRAARWVGELSMPGVAKLTPGSQAASQIIGGGVIAGADTWLGNENNAKSFTTPPPTATMPTTAPIPPVRPLAELEEEDDDEPHDEKATLLNKALELIPDLKDNAAAAIGIAATIAMPKAAKGMTPIAQAGLDAASQAAKNAKATGAFTSGGPPSHINPDMTRPTVRTGMWDQFTPAREMLTKYTGRTEARQTLDAATATAGSNQTQMVQNLFNYGYTPGMTKGTIPLQQINDVVNVFDRNGKAADFFDWMADQRVIGLRETRVKDIKGAIAENAQAYRVATKKQNYGKMSRLQAQASELRSLLKNVEDDHPDFRAQYTLRSMDDMKVNVAKWEKDADFVKLRDMIRKSFDDNIDFRVANGRLSQEDAAAMKAHNPDYMTFVDDPLEGRGTLARLTEKIKRKFNPLYDPYGDQPKMGMLSPSKATTDALDLNTKPVNQPMNVLEGLLRTWENSMRFEGREKFKGSVINAAMDAERASPKGHIKQIENNGQTSFTLKQARKLIADGIIKPVKAGEDGGAVSLSHNGRIEFYEFPNDPLAARSLEQAPSYTLPLARGMSHWWRVGATGWANPPFALKNFLWDNMAKNALRPRGMDYGFDYALRVLSGNRIPQSILDATRLGTTVFDPISFGLDVADTFKLFYKMNAKLLADSVTDALIQDQGFFAILAKTPGGKAWVQQLGQSASKVFNDSMVPTLMHNNALDLPNLNRLTRVEQEASKLFKLNTSGIKNSAWGSIPRIAAQQYLFALGAMRNASKYGLIARNIERLRDPAGNIDWDSKAVKNLMAEARILGSGDVARKPGSAFMQGATSAIPYLDTGIRTTQAAWHRMSEDPKLAGIVLSGVVIPAIMSDMIMSNWDKDAYDYRWRQMPNWRRVSTVTFYSPQTALDIIKWKMGDGPRVPFSRDKVHEFEVMQEFRPIIAMGSHIFRAMGLYGAGQNDPFTGGQTLPGALADIAEALKQQFDPMMPPIVNLAARSANAPGEISLLSPLLNVPARMAGASSDEASFSPFIQRGAATRAGTPMNYTSDIDATTMNLIQTVFSTAGSRLAQAYDTGHKVYQGTGSVWEGMLAGGKEMKDRTTELSMDVPLVSSVRERVYRYNDVAKHAKEMRNYIRVVTGAPDSVRKPVGDPVLDGIAVVLRQQSKNAFYRGHAKAYKKLNEDYKKLDAQRYDKTKGSAISYEEREAEKNRYAKAMNNLDQQQTTLLNDMQTRVARRFGEQYKQKFGEPFTLANWAKRIKQADRMLKGNKPVKPIPRRYAGTKAGAP